MYPIHHGHRILARRRLRAVLPVVLTGLILVTAVAPSRGQGSADELLLPPNPAAGGRLFIAKGCIECHSVGGQGGAIGPDLTRATERMNVAEIAAAMWNHAPSMQRQMAVFGITPPTFRPAEITALIGFLYYLNFQQPILGDARHGRSLFESKYCEICHRVDGYGSGSVRLDELQRHLTPVVVAQRLWNHGPTLLDQMRVSGLRLPAISGQDVADLVAFLRSTTTTPESAPRFDRPGDPASGARVFASAGCADCHRRGGPGPDLRHAHLTVHALEIIARLWDHLPRMEELARQRKVPLRTLEEEQMADLLAYLYSLNYTGMPGNPRRGRTLFQDKHCLECHRFGGDRETLGPDLLRSQARRSLADGLAALWNHSGNMLRTMKDAQVDWPRLNGRDISDLLAYIRQSGRDD